MKNDDLIDAFLAGFRASTNEFNGSSILAEKDNVLVKELWPDIIEFWNQKKEKKTK